MDNLSPRRGDRGRSVLRQEFSRMRPLLNSTVITLVLHLAVLANGDRTFGEHETYRIVNSSDIKVDLIIKGNGNDYELSLEPRTWCSVVAEGKVEKRVIVWPQDTGRIRAYSHIRFNRIPDEHGIGIPIIYIDNANSLHLLSLGKGSLVLLDRVSNGVLDDKAVPNSYIRDPTKQHFMYSEKDLTKK